MAQTCETSTDAVTTSIQRDHTTHVTTNNKHSDDPSHYMYQNYYHYMDEYLGHDTMDDSAMTSSSRVRAADRIVVARRTVWRVDRAGRQPRRAAAGGSEPAVDINKKKLPNFVLPDGAGAQHELAAVTLHDDLELDGPRR